MRFVVNIDSELSSIELTQTRILLDFGNVKIGLGAEFLLDYESFGTRIVEKIDPWKRTGDLCNLWKLIGIRTSGLLVAEEAAQIAFESNYNIWCGNSTNYELIEVWNGGEFFTYPQILSL